MMREGGEESVALLSPDPKRPASAYMVREYPGFKRIRFAFRRLAAPPFGDFATPA